MTMGDSLRVTEYLTHIVDAIDRIILYVDGMTQQAFLEDPKTQDAVVRNFEVAGEAAHNVETRHAAFAALHSDVPWAIMYTMRNRIAHGYFKVDFELVWKTIQVDLPPLRARVGALIGR
jgi:uncharacterized protein with HEPN domain